MPFRSERVLGEEGIALAGAREREDVDRVGDGCRPAEDGQQGGGGTDFRPIFNLLESHEPDVLIYLTDGYGDFPAQAPKVSTLWVVPPGGLEDEGFPFGDVLRLEEH